jgi:DNA adenine methylase
MSKEIEYIGEKIEKSFEINEPHLFDYTIETQFNIQSFTSRSPLRYPGGKSRGVQTITSFFPKNLRVMLSPFFGGGSIELFMATKGVKVLGYDIFGPLVEFWQCLLNNPELLALEVEKYFPLPKEKFYQLQISQNNFFSKLERAAIFYVLNRASFSGSTLSGGMSPEHPRFTKTSIDRIKDFFNPNISIEQLDFKESLMKYPNIFTYLDPPYLIKNSLYGLKGNTHKEFDHETLALILSNREKWILSYNDCTEIRDLYSQFYILTPEWKYGMSNNKSSKEVLIFSKDLKSKK